MTNYALDEQVDPGNGVQANRGRVERGIRLLLLLGFTFVLLFEAWMIWSLFRIH